MSVYVRVYVSVYACACVCMCVRVCVCASVRIRQEERYDKQELIHFFITSDTLLLLSFHVPVPPFLPYFYLQQSYRSIYAAALLNPLQIISFLSFSFANFDVGNVAEEFEHK